MYLSYEEYQAMGGMLNETAFNELEFEARSYIDLYTYRRLQSEQSIPQAVKQCMFYLIQLIDKQHSLLGTSSNDTNNTNNVAVTSQSNDGVSISYNVLSASELLKSTQAEMKSTVDRYLQGVRNSLGKRLLFTGLYPDE